MKFTEVFPLPGGWLTDVDLMLAETVTRWAEQDVIPKRLEYREDRERLLLPAYKRLAIDIGLQSMMWPEAAGGSGQNAPGAAVTVAAVVEQAGRADVGIAFALANMFAVQATFAVGSARDEAACERWQATFCGDEPCFVGLALPGHGAGGEAAVDPSGLDFPVQTAAATGGRHLTGRDVRLQAMGRDADLLAVTCQVNGAPALVLVPGDTAGITIGDLIKTIGPAIGRDAAVDFEQVFVGEDKLLFADQASWRRFFGWYHLGCAAACAGASLAGWEILKGWGESRVIKGKGQTFKENPLVASLLGKVGAAIGTNRLLVFNLAQLIAQSDAAGQAGAGRMFATSTAIVRQVCRESMNALNHAMELMASAGYATEWELERYWRDVKAIENRIGPLAAARLDMARHYFDLQTL